MIEDRIVRWHRMAGDEVLWLPGIDHMSSNIYHIRCGPVDVATDVQTL